MLNAQKNVPPSVYLVADHLDSALAAGEDLLAANSHWTPGGATDCAVAGAQRWAISRFRTHELNLVSRIVQAREHVEVLSRDARRFRPLAQLFNSASADLADAFEELHLQISGDFDTGGGHVAYLRSRGLIDSEAPGLCETNAIKINDTFLVAGKVPLGICMDLVSEFLDALDVAYDLYPADDIGDLKDAA
ncbi:MAG: hypothetical protein K0U74_01495 [Alphaproteobacteria bacterium]|nr:hypothetical protein [Alphaproteobacteria bacterium]